MRGKNIKNSIIKWLPHAVAVVALLVSIFGYLSSISRDTRNDSLEAYELEQELMDLLEIKPRLGTTGFTLSLGFKDTETSENNTPETSILAIAKIKQLETIDKNRSSLDLFKYAYLSKFSSADKFAEHLKDSSLGISESEALVHIAKKLSREGISFQAVEEYFEDAIHLEPQNNSIKASYAKFLHREGKSEHAIKLLSEAKRAEPLHPIYRNMLAHIYLESGRLRLGELELRDLIRKKIANGQSYNMLAIVYLEVHKSRRKAIKLFHKSIDKSSDNGLFHFHLGLAYALDCNIEQAERYFRNSIHFGFGSFDVTEFVEPYRAECDKLPEGYRCVWDNTNFIQDGFLGEENPVSIKSCGLL